MKILLSILFSGIIGLGFSQTKPDGTQLAGLDSTLNSTIITEISPIELYLRDSSINFQYFSSSGDYYISLYQTIPNCSELIKRNGLFFLKNDSATYCGNCVILYNEEIRQVIYKGNGEPKFYITGTPFWEYDKFIDLNGSKIKIVSSYLNGKRDGNREYFDTLGNLIKIEIYHDGKLISTIYPDKK